MISRRRLFVRRFLALFALGLFGVIMLVPVIAPLVRSQLAARPEITLSPELATALSLINPTVLLAVAVAIGIRLAPTVGLRSLIDDRVTEGRPVWPGLRPDLPLALGWGLAGGLILTILDVASRPWVGTELSESDAAAGPLAALISGLFYGGITEELLIRWGLMTLLVWAGWRLSGRRARPAVFWTAILISALLFGAGHLPAVAAMAPLAPALVIRTIALNAIGGVIFGWLFWRRSLEAAMVCHATFHVAFALVNQLA